MIFWNKSANVVKQKARNTNLGDVKITGKKTPVNVSTIADVGIVAVGCCFLEHLLHQTLVVARVLQEQFDNGCEDLKLCLGNVSIRPLLVGTSDQPV